jgi:type I restriction enzyme, S subunit
MVRTNMYVFPLPPLEEQKRIVAKIENLTSYVDKYDVAYSEVVQLNKKFPEDMQNSILQYAIQGKLVKQQEDEIPFDIPENWKWVRLGDVIELLSGQDFPPEKYNDMNKGIPYITGASSLSNMGVIINRWTEQPRCIANTGDVLLVCKGSGYGKIVICDVKKAHVARQIMTIKNSDLLNMSYLKYFLNASHSLIKGRGQGVIPCIDRKSV